MQFVGCHKFQTVADNQPDTVQEPQHIQTIPNPTSNPSANRPTQNPSNLLKQVHNISDPKPVHGQPTATALASTRVPEPVRRHRTAEDTRIVQANLVLKPILKGYRYSQRSPPGYQATNYRKPSPSSQTGSQTYSNPRQAQPAHSGTDLASKMAQSILERILGKSVVQTLSKRPKPVVITTTTAPTTTSPLGEVEPPEIEGPTTTPTPTTTPAPAWPRQRLAASSGYLGNYWPRRGTQLSAGSGNSSAILYWKHTSAHAWWRCKKSCL